MEAVFEGSVAPQLIRGWGGMGGEQGLARDESNENLSLQMKKNDEGIESLHISGQFNEISRKVRCCIADTEIFFLISFPSLLSE